MKCSGLNRWVKGFSLLLLVSLALPPSSLLPQGQPRNPSEESEIIFSSKDERKWTEKREIPLLLVTAQGIKEEPRIDSFPLREEAIGPMKKMSPSGTAPGCAYSRGFTTGIARTFVGDKALYEQGRHRYFEGNYEDAIHSLRKLVKEYPASALLGAALYWMGEARFRQGEEDEAYLYFRKVVETYPGSEFDAYALYSCGWIQLEKTNYGTGHHFFQRVPEKYPTHSIAESSLFWSGYCLYHLHRYAETRVEMERLLRDYPSGKWRPEAEYLMGVSLFRLKEFSEAALLFNGFWKQFPKHPLVESARYAWAWSLISLGRFSEARKIFEDVLLSYPGTRFSDPIYWGILQSYLGDNEVEKALYLYQNFLSHFLPPPWIEQCLFDIGQYYFDRKEYTVSSATFRQFLRTFPESDLTEWVYFMLGDSLFNQGDYPGAIAAYQRVLEEKKKARLEPQIFSRMGYAYFYRKEYERALGYWDRFLSDFPDDPDKDGILYWAAEASLQRQDCRKAVEYLERLPGDSTLYPKGLNSLGWYHFQRGEWTEANHYFLKLLEKYPQYRAVPSLFLTISECYLNGNDPQQARTYLVRLVNSAEEGGNKEKAFYLLGWIAYKAEQFDEAIGQFRHLLESYPLSPYRAESQYWIACCFFRKKDFQKSVEEFQSLILRYPESSFVSSSLLKVGDAYYNLKQYASAIQNYSRLVKEFPKSKEAPEADFGIILSFYQDKKYETFISRGEAFLKEYPTHALVSQVLLQLGEYYEQHRMRDKAIRAYRELIQLGPHWEGVDEAQYHIALLLKQEKRWSEAVGEMEKFLKQSPPSRLFVEAQVEMGDLYLFLKDYPKALERYEWVIQNHPDHPLVRRAYLGVEEGYQGSGKIEQAEKALKEMISKFPQDDLRFEAMLRLGLLYLSQKRLAEAIAALPTAARSPDDRVASQAQFKLGEAYLEKGDRESALLQFSKVVYLYPHRPEVVEEALLKLGALYLEENRPFEARQIYQKLLEKTKKDDRREMARKVLEQIERGTVR